jgi:superfamily II DNA or RNA helicase
MEASALVKGAVVDGLSPQGRATVVAVDWHDGEIASVTYRDAAGHLADQVVYDLASLTLAEGVAGTGRPFDSDGALFRLAAEAHRMRLAGLFDPMLAIATSDVRPLPHQIRAVYGELLPRTPLRFLLADDPGAGKTIMAGLYIKELLLRGDLARCLVVVPGGLVEQWQDELLDKFGLEFDILDAAMASHPAGRVFDRHPLLLARMDQLARSEDLLDELRDSEWDVVVVDEAHRMSAHYYGNRSYATKRYELGQLLGTIGRHLLLMTATPHAGKEADYQLFLALLDADRFEGRYRPGVHSQDTSGLMRRMVKEDLLTFEGKPLFPERVAETVPYKLSPLENELYDAVTDYVRHEMNRADRLDPSRRNTVGFALTVLQRRLASSPEAIFQSLVRRQRRLRKRRIELLNPGAAAEERSAAGNWIAPGDDPYDDEIDAARREELETTLVDAATSAETAAELEAELAVLTGLEALASRVRESGDDRKWSELRALLLDRHLLMTAGGTPRKLIVFTEHRDTLSYLSRRIATLLGRQDGVTEIHGGVPRLERRRRTEEFSNNPLCQVLVATDAAGEGLNLQRAHLMVNYDLPWNPNRIEQRFGRIHRIGQTEVCRLWNLVATDTREGQVFTQLLAKIEEQRKALGGRVFDVLGETFAETPLRELLMKAVRYGDRPDVRAQLDRVIDSEVSQGLRQLVEERALTSEILSTADLQRLRREMDEARARRLQPHYVEMFVREALGRLGGRISRRETGRYEISHVPAALRGRRGRRHVVSRYERVTFDPAYRRRGGSPSVAELLTPGHPLVDAVLDETLHLHGDVVRRGAMLVDPRPTQGEMRLLVALAEEIVDGLGERVARRFSYLYVDREGRVSAAGPAPYLDLRPIGDEDDPARVPDLTWCTTAEESARRWAIGSDLPPYVREVEARLSADIARTRTAVDSRLKQEANRLQAEAAVASEREAAGLKVKVRSATLVARAEDLEQRRTERLRRLDAQASLQVRPPLVAGAAAVVPATMVRRAGGDAEPESQPLTHAKDTREVDRRAVDAALGAERGLDRLPKEMPHNNPGFDITSLGADGHVVHLEVKGRIEGAEDFFVTYNEVLFGKNAAPGYRLVLVKVSPRGASYDEVRYVADPFATTELGSFESTGIVGSWAKTWSAGHEPF